jgi:hypothetical protein
MTLYYSIADPLDVRDIADLYAMWVEIGNPKANLWAEQPSPPVYDASSQHAPEWGDGEWVVRDLTPDELAAAARSNLAAYWASQPAWIRGPFDSSYQSAVSLLDRHDIDAAIAIITYAPIPSAYDADQLAAFEPVRATLLAGLESLIPE